MLWKHFGFTTVAVLTLALGVGATSALFSVVYAVFAPMPYPNPDQLVMVWSRIQGERNSVSPGDYFDWKQRSQSFQAMGAWSGDVYNVATKERPEQINGSPRTPGFFLMEGLPMLLGRDFLPEDGEPGKDSVVILSNRLWSKHFGADANIIGKQIRMNGQPYTVVGVLPAGMYDRLPMELWVPLAFKSEQLIHDAHFLLVMARLKDGVTIEQAQAEMNGIAAQLATEHPKTNTNWGVSVEPLHLNFLEKTTRRNLWLLLGAVGFLLLIGCVNVANLLLARGTVRQREVAVRAALGASRLRLFSQFLTESFVLAVVGGVAGILLAGLILDLMQLVMPPVGTMLPSEADIRISIPVVLFTVGITTISGLLFGSIPAWQATRHDLNEVLKSGGRAGAGSKRRNALRLLVVAEFSLALTLLACGGLAFKGFWNLTKIDLGIRPEHVLTFTLQVPERKLTEPDQIRSYYQQILEKIRATPGVKNAAAVTGLPGRGPGFGMPVSIVGQPEVSPSDRPAVGFQMVTPEYVDTLGIRIVKGRGINENDTTMSPRVAVVNETFVNRFLPGVDPLTQRVKVEEIMLNATLGKPVEWQIVGVYHDVRGAGSREQFPEMNVPFSQMAWPRVFMAVRSEGDPKAMTKSIASAVNSVDPDLPLAGVKTIEELVDEALAIDRFSMVLFASFGALGLMLAAVGIYSVISFGVAQRTQEFGVRMALGAQRSRVVKQVLKEGAILAGLGTLIGLVGAYLVGRAMQSTLYGVGAMDGRAFALLSLLLVTVALVASLFPALRASKVEPTSALRAE
jgi:putative ABC transport system permease protein